MGKLILIRHGESEGNRDRLFSTRPSELALTELGRKQARDAAARIAKRFMPALAVTSAYLRARETAEIIAALLGVPLEVEHELRERDIGDLMGKPYEVVAQDPTFDPARPWLWTPPGGESFEQVRRRVGPVLDGLALAHPRSEVIVVSHGGVMLSLWAHVGGSWDGAHFPENGGVVLVEHEEGRYLGPPKVIDD